MVLGRPFQCPTRIYSNRDYEGAVADLIGGRSWALATSKGWLDRGAVDRLVSSAAPCARVIDAIPANPTALDVERLADALPQVDVVVALGGGSVMDCAKGLVAIQALGERRDAFRAHLREGATLPDDFEPAPLICVPTTSGTGSEVTRWATVWGEEKVKYSLQHVRLYPADVVLDPKLCVSMPHKLTLASGLDALSHAMEAIWNRHNTPVSDQMAETAIGLLRRRLPQALEAPEDLEARRQVQLAALMSGLAMGTTQTALAHSISYPFTAQYGMPHGFACSFTLAEVARYNMELNSARLSPIATAFRCDLASLPDAIEAWLITLGAGTYISEYVGPDVIDTFKDELITRARAANNLRDVHGSTAKAIAKRSLERLCGNRASLRS